MHPRTVGVLLLLLLLLLHPRSSSHLEEEVPLEVIVNSSSCSTTCGLGVKTQTLCALRDGQTAMEEGVSRAEQVSESCRVRTVGCRQPWQCGLRTMTVTSGQRVEMDCVGDLKEDTGRFSWRVSWRLARGIISSDDSLFSRWDAPQLDRVILDPVREEDAGTYRCDVQDASFRRVKRVYYGVRVLPAGILNLDVAPPDQQQFHENKTKPSDYEVKVAVLLWYWALLLVCMVIMIPLLLIRCT